MWTIRQGLLSALKLLCIVLFSVLVLVVVWQVFTRQVLGDPSPWTTVTAQYMFVWLSLFAATLVFGERGHIAVDVLAQRAPGAVRQVLVVAVQACTLAFAVLAMIWGGLRGVSMSWDQVIPGFPFTVGHMYLALPVAGVMIAFLALEDLLLAVRGDELAPLEETDDEAAERAGAAAAAAVTQGSQESSLPEAEPTTDTEKER
ncbi:TRAP transporter small permease [Brachybacterium massiliense]|uniref:TRAP transporter small permease n=1 Tax=Brachybacterium massiliense TaxID=1755098 RepID=UPI000B3BC4CF|nr:TRAP transporter small permease [Brachybacterium massiliense]